MLSLLTLNHNYGLLKRVEIVEHFGGGSEKCL